jgi:hypothetical protein
MELKLSKIRDELCRGVGPARNGLIGEPGLFFIHESNQRENKQRNTQQGSRRRTDLVSRCLNLRLPSIAHYLVTPGNTTISINHDRQKEQSIAHAVSIPFSFRFRLIDNTMA